MLALADIALSVRSREVTVWLDDTLSMATRETNGTRLELAWRQLQALRDREGLDGMEIRSLTNPARSYSLNGPPPSAVDEPPEPPAASALRRDQAQWLLTDGSSMAINRWAVGAGLQRRITLGTNSENFAVRQLAARPSLSQPGQFRLDVEIHNAGLAAGKRLVILHSDAQVVAQQSLQLSAGASQRLQFTVPLAAEGWSVQLQPNDALAADDQLDLPARALQPLRVQLDPRCPAAVKSALHAHAGLREAARDATAELAVSCSGATAAAVPTLLLQTASGRPSQAIEAVWTAEARAALSFTSLPPLLLAHGSVAGAGSDMQVMLQGAGAKLVTRSAEAPYRVATSLDFASSAMSAQAEYALLFAQLIDLTLDKPWLSPLAEHSRSIAETRLAALPGAASATPSRDADGRRRINLSVWLLAVAALAVLWDLVSSWHERQPS
jgi:hypothetical protein